YDKNFADYKSASRFSDNETIEALLAKTYETTKDISEAIKNANNLIQFYKDTLSQRNLRPNAAADTHLATLSDYTSQANSHLTSLLAVKTSIKNNQEAIIDSDRTIAEKTASLADLKAGTDPLDIQSQEISVKQKENSLLDAYEKLADYSVKAPFAGVIASVEIEKGDSVTSATALATLITKQQIAEISLNEVDVAKVKIGQKATITFDAVTDLTITGQVVEIDEIGTVSQGVVSYNVKIAFDVQDQRVKPGMSLSVSIVTDSKQDVLVVPIGAVKTLGTESYVQILTNNQPERKTVVVGISSDTMSEIVSGLSEGDEVITQTITGAASSSATNISSNKSNSNAMRGIMQLEGGAGGPGR
ncbi:MAG: efflux RND transporter periplasmic adaptor subunit, partial [Candidatus Buchananbacteria bacterium]